MGRSRGVRCVVACQDFAQLEEVHGPLFVRALTSMCGTLVVGQMSPGETAEQLCKNLGSREHERRNVSVSIDSTKRSETVSFCRESVPLYSPSELASRLGPTRDGKGVNLLVVAGGDAHELFYPIIRLRRARRAHAPAPWTLGVGAASATPANAPGVPNRANTANEPGAVGDASHAAPPGASGAMSAPAGPSASSAVVGGHGSIDPTIAELLASDFPELGERDGFGESDGESGGDESGSEASAARPSP